MAEAKTNPTFPTNRHNLENGSKIRSNDPEVEAQLGVKVGDEIEVVWDGMYVISGEFTWDVEQLCQEIDGGYWVVVEKTAAVSDQPDQPQPSAV